MKTKRLLIAIISLAIVLTGCLAAIGASAAGGNSSDGVYADLRSGKIKYFLPAELAGEPTTMEAWVLIDEDIKGDLGNLFSNELEIKSKDMVSYHVDENGRMRVEWDTDDRIALFDKVDLRNGKWTHVAVVRDKEFDGFKLYVNGELMQEVACGAGRDLSEFPSRFCIGGDWNEGFKVKEPFLGKVRQITLYNRTISAGEVERDYYNSANISSANRSGLLFNAIVDGTKKELVDTSIYKNNPKIGSNDLYYDGEPYETKDYSIALIPDLQIMTNHLPEAVDNLPTYLLDHYEEKKIGVAITLGDLTDGNINGSKNNTNFDKMYKKVDEQFSRLDGDDPTKPTVPYIYVAGNHDYDNECSTDHSATYFDKYLKQSKQEQWECWGGSYEGSLTNAYYLFEFCGVKYCIFALDFGASDEVIDWCCRVTEHYSDRRIIMATHGFLAADGHFLTSEYSGAPSKYGWTGKGVTSVNDADQMWDKWLSRYPNIFMVCCGHVGIDEILLREHVGIHGNVVPCILLDGQSMQMNDAVENMLGMMTFDEKEQLIYFNYYSLIQNNQLFNYQSQYVYSFKGNTDILSPLYYPNGASDTNLSYDLTVTDDNGIAGYSAKARAGQLVKLTIDSDEYVVDGYVLDGVKYEGNSFVMPDADTQVRVTLKKITQGAHAINVIGGEGGVTVASLSRADAGETVTLTNYADYGYVVTRYLVNGSEIEGNSFTMPASDVSVTTEYYRPLDGTQVSMLLHDSTYADATSYWKAEYTPDALVIDIVVEDYIVYTVDNLQKNFGMTDNVECMLGLKASAGESYTTSNYRILAAAGGETYFSRYNGNGWSNAYADRLDISVVKLLPPEDYMKGYIVKMIVPYQAIGLTYAQALGNITICPAMRNTTQGRFWTMFKSYSEYGVNWNIPKTHLLIDENGAFVRNVVHADTVFAGNGLMFGWDSATKDLSALNVGSTFNVSAPDTTLSYWKEHIWEIAERTPAKIFFSCGGKDLLTRSTLSVFNETLELVKLISNETSGAKITLVGALPVVSADTDVMKIAAFNSMLADYAASTKDVDYIAMDGFIGGNKPRLSFYSSADTLSNEGFAYLKRAFLEKYGAYAAKEGTFWGNFGDYTADDTYWEDGNTLFTNGEGTRNVYVKNYSGGDFTLELKLTVNTVYNNDALPKFGFALHGALGARAYYIDGAENLSAQYAGAVSKLYTGYDWDNLKSVNVPGLKYSGGSYATLKIVKKGGTINFYCNDVLVSSEESFDVQAISLFTFNTGLKIINYSLTEEN